jgi:hypothetical protein
MTRLKMGLKDTGNDASVLGWLICGFAMEGDAADLYGRRG